MGCFIAILVGAIGFALSWIITCGLVALVCSCFGWGFSWLIATGVWCLLLLLRAAVK